MRPSSAFATLLIALAACERGPAPAPQGNTDLATHERVDGSLITEPVPVESEVQGWEMFTPHREEFIARYAGFTRVGDADGLLLLASGAAEAIDKRRWELPAGHLLHLDSLEEGLSAFDRVLVRLRLPGTEGGLVYIVHSLGPSGDPGFYVTTDRSSTEGMPFAVQTASGQRGWARISTMQCFVQVLRGICFRGD